MRSHSAHAACGGQHARIRVRRQARTRTHERAHTRARRAPRALDCACLGGSPLRGDPPRQACPRWPLVIFIPAHARSARVQVPALRVCAHAHPREACDLGPRSPRNPPVGRGPQPSPTPPVPGPVDLSLGPGPYQVCRQRPKNLVASPQVRGVIQRLCHSLVGHAPALIESRNRNTPQQPPPQRPTGSPGAAHGSGGAGRLEALPHRPRRQLGAWDGSPW